MSVRGGDSESKTCLPHKKLAYRGSHLVRGKGRARQRSKAVVGKTGGNSSHPTVHLTAVEEAGEIGNILILSLLVIQFQNRKPWIQFLC